VTIFIILTGENWNEIMVLVMDNTKAMLWPAIFFMTIMVIGNYMLLNLFLAILLKFISENGEADLEEDPEDIKNNETLQKANSLVNDEH
jgi:voltage-dependent calcium channel L type alpha-1D